MHRMVFVKRDSSTIMLLTNSLETRGIGLLGQTSQSRHRVANRGLLKDIIPLVEFGVASQVFQVPERFMDGISSHTILHNTSGGCIAAGLATDCQTDSTRQPRS